MLKIVFQDRYAAYAQADDRDDDDLLAAGTGNKLDLEVGRAWRAYGLDMLADRD